jgi:hypothetical protein
MVNILIQLQGTYAKNEKESVIRSNIIRHSHPSSEAYTIACIATCSFTRTSNFDNLATCKPIIPCDRVRELDAGKLGFLQTAEIGYVSAYEWCHEGVYTYYLSRSNFFSSGVRTSCLGTRV